jgi:hypothetical protein
LCPVVCRDKGRLSGRAKTATYPLRKAAYDHKDA